MATANKLCFKKALDHKNSNCRKNYSIAKSISSSESKLVRENLEHTKNNGMLEVKSVTSDASTQINKSLRNYARDTNQNIKHYKGFVHKLPIVQSRARQIVGFAGSGPIFGTEKRFISRQEAEKSVHETLYFSRFYNIQTDIVTCQNCSHLIIRCYLASLRNRDRK